MQPTPVFFPGECHGQRGLVGPSPWGRKELDTTKQLTHTHTHTHTHTQGTVNLHTYFEDVSDQVSPHEPNYLLDFIHTT